MVSVVASIAALAGCATYQGEVYEARSALAANDPSKAAALLKPLAEKENRDQLVYLLDYATALQQAKRFKESAKAFQDAEKIADIQDYHSISNIAGAALFSEEMVQYKGDDYEKVLINAMNAINYLEMDSLDEALVEVRRLNQKLYKFKYEAKRDYAQNPYALYLGAMIYEADRKWDDAYINYKQAYELAPGFTPLREDLIRGAQRAGRSEDVTKWKREFTEVKPRSEWNDKTVGEIVFIYEQGWGPRKQSRPEEPRFPKLFPVGSQTKLAKVFVDGTERARTDELFDITTVAIKTLDDDYGRLVASRVGGVVAKAVVADQIGQKDELLGAIAWVAMNVADRADLRQWSTLPDTFQVARMYVKPGKYKVTAKGLDASGAESGEVMDEREVEVKPGRKAFVSWRSVR
ncbi:MAG: hypothetical protein V4760_08470, partial [Bdellovibrionota bacterium]